MYVYMCDYVKIIIIILNQEIKVIATSLQDMVKWITLVLAFTVLLCYGWFGMSHHHKQGNNGLLITLLVSHMCM